MRGYLPALVDAGAFALPAGDGATAWIDTRDIAAAAAAVLLADPPPAEARTLTLTGPEALTMGDVAGVVGRPARSLAELVAEDPEAWRP